MQWYERVLFPRLCDRAMRAARLDTFRARVAGEATGYVLEIGIGSALNLPFYDARAVRGLVGLEPSPSLAAMTRERVAGAAFPVRVIEGSAEAIPLPDSSVDTVVSTWTLCSIPALETALSEIHRVLVPHGRLLFAEHGLAPERSVRRWQHGLTPLWRVAAAGCHLDRAVAERIGAAGFTIERLETGYIRGPRPLTYMYEGVAIARPLR